jgi:hypothetical protein
MQTGILKSLAFNVTVMHWHLEHPFLKLGHFADTYISKVTAWLLNA